MDILLNNEKIDFTLDDFPMLISGAEKTGASFFSIILLAELLKNGAKVLFFSAYPDAKVEFRKQFGAEVDQAIIIDSGEESALLESLEKIPDLSERVVLIKNIDSYSSKLFEAVQTLELVIFSGDLDKCQFADKLIKKDFITKVFFSQSTKYPQAELGDLPKYSGQVISDRYDGLIILRAIK